MHYTEKNGKDIVYEQLLVYYGYEYVSQGHVRCGYGFKLLCS
jgi:hypothetical protein